MIALAHERSRVSQFSHGLQTSALAPVAYTLLQRHEVREGPKSEGSAAMAQLRHHAIGLREQGWCKHEPNSFCGRCIDGEIVTVRIPYRQIARTCAFED